MDQTQYRNSIDIEEFSGGCIKERLRSLKKWFQGHHVQILRAYATGDIISVTHAPLAEDMKRKVFLGWDERQAGKKAGDWIARHEDIKSKHLSITTIYTSFPAESRKGERFYIVAVYWDR